MNTSKEKIKLSSGAELEIDLISFKDSLSLFKSVAEELLKVGIDIDSVDLDNISSAEITGDMVNVVKNTILTLIVSSRIEEQLSNAFKRCTYNNMVIDDETFRPIEARQDYFPTCIEVLKFNLSPFLPKKGLSLLEKFAKNKKPQKLK